MKDKKKKVLRKYTEKENQVLLKCVEEANGKIMKGCNLAAKVLGDRTAKALEVHYYTSLKNCKNVVVVNTPAKRKYTRKHTIPLAPHLYVMKKMLALTIEERNKVLNFFRV